ncbi:hypothetical protein [Nocardioides dongkuii]|uniref:hypothetical protein n=1 Tax=Nocardioides dongkuii TaxID=2760089 RepID=UPI0015FD3C3A|nr:hypothetical protein [Nocardioides dongkuii]
MPTLLLTLRRLLVVVLVAGAGALATPWAAPAAAAPAPRCSCTAADTADDTERLARVAGAVLTGTVTAAAAAPRADGGRGSTYTHAVDVDLVYKGNVRDEQVEVATDGGTRSACELGELPAGVPYVFFVDDVDGTLVAEPCGGTQRKRATLVAELEALYGEGEAPRPEAPAETAEIEPVADATEPASFTRTAAPGAAMVLVGLLGWVVVRRLARRP